MVASHDLLFIDLTQVKKRSVYDLLIKVNRGLELIDAVPQDVQDYYLKR